ncbi:sulfur carrier protein ThiS [Neobacillus sp. M.A.Huq-85]|nr:sulfur carrier protein ThiS [Neobacillus cucumis]
MKLLINGERVVLPQDLEFVSDVLRHYEVHNKVVVVELNGKILTKMEHQSTRISDKDKIEIVHFVGGG